MSIRPRRDANIAICNQNAALSAAQRRSPRLFRVIGEFIWRARCLSMAQPLRAFAQNFASGWIKLDRVAIVCSAVLKISEEKWARLLLIAPHAGAAIGVLRSG